MASIVASDLIASSMRLIGAIATGETPSANEVRDGVSVLNDLVDAWALENLMLYRNENDSFTLTAGKGSYTIGVGGDFNVTRPVTIEQAFVTAQGGLDLQLRPPLTTDEWNRIALKAMQAPIPQAIYYVPTFPLGNVYVWPVPSQSIQLTLSLNMQFSQLSDGAQTISYPPGYAKALRFCLAVELAPEFGVEAPATVQRTARETLRAIKAANRQQPKAHFDAALTGGGCTGLADFLAGNL